MRPRAAFRSLLLPAALALSASVAALADEAVLWSAGQVALRGAGRQYSVTTPSGVLSVRLPAGVEVEDLFALRQGGFLSARGPLLAGGNPHRDLFLALVDSQGLHELPSPPLPAGRSRENAVPLTSRSGDLEGVAWLEGPDRQRNVLEFAVWDGMRWSEPTVIAAEAPGSQLALAATTLEDGSQLLLWARFDGQDDEIVAARRVRGVWNAPVPVAADNSVPDLTPAVTAVPGGALAAWSRYDGHDYRVVVSRFDGETWSAPVWAGPVGSTTPFFTPSASLQADRSGPGGPPPVWLAFASVRPRGWGVLELAPEGTLRRAGNVATSEFARPALEVQASGEVKLRWAATELDVELRETGGPKDPLRQE